jgi:4-aminobutyrate aminotransferase / (S)-3-amino-2-methylpropionate transaminase / 5-aminovalerate transaminase
MTEAKTHALPGAKSRALQAEREKYLPRGIACAMPFVAERAEGVYLWDTGGNRYYDFAGGIGVLNIGHNHPKVVAAIKAQADKLLHSCFQVIAYEPYLRLVKALCERTKLSGPAKAALFNSGAEAVENAVKFARAFTGRQAVIAFSHAFHGRTLLAMTLTGKEEPYKRGFGPFAPEVYRARYPYPYRCPRRVCPSSGQACSCASELEEMFKTTVSPSNVAAMIVEPVIGEGGFMAAPPEFLQGVRRLCDEHGIVMIADEVQSGFGRTGRFFAVEHSEVEPDIIVSAKSLAGGMPLSAVIGRADILDSVHIGGIGSTYGGNPLSCAAALAVLEVFDEEHILEKAQRLGERLWAHFEGLKNRYGAIGEVRGLGPMIALEFVKDPATKEPDPEAVGRVIAAAWQRGLILLRAGQHGNVLRCLVPLIIEDDELEEALAILDEAVEAALTGQQEVGD